MEHDLLLRKLGVRTLFQSPLLFSLFISDLDSNLRQNNATSIRIRRFHVTSLMFADDLAILAGSHTRLQQPLKSLYVYCSHLRIKVNANKTKIMIINSSRSNTNQEQCFSINNVRVETVKQHKYISRYYSTE